jgi:hypothetical protein
MRTASRVLAILTLLAAQPLAAQNQETLKFTNPGSTVGFGYFVGPYQATVLSQPGTPTLDIYCVDFLHGISVGTVWTAGMRSLSGDLTGTRGGNGAYDTYLKAAWLASQYAVTPPTQWKHIQATIWNLFAASAPDASSNYWLNQANANYQSVDASAWTVVTDVTSPGVQEFLTQTYVTPEPSTYLLLATGLFFLGFVYLRRTKPGLIRS